MASVLKNDLYQTIEIKPRPKKRADKVEIKEKAVSYTAKAFWNRQRAARIPSI